jgi:uncharacterized delta-60 repeat protein
MESRSLLAYGDIDLGFGTAGEMRFALPNEVDSSDRASPAVFAPDGGLWVAGASDSKSALARITPTGKPDNSFSGDGVATYSILGADYTTAITSLHSLSDGRVVICGPIYGQPNSAFVARVLPNGSLDPSFEPWISVAGTGLVLLQSQNDQVFAMESDYRSPFGLRSYRVLKFAENGSLDSGFGVNGASKPIEGGTGSFVVFAKSDANQIQFGIAENGFGTSPRILSYRFLKNGQVDLNFGVNGKEVVDVPSSVLSANSWLDVDSNTFLVARNDIVNGQYGTFVQKLDLHNGMDVGFGTNGVLALPNPIQTFYGSSQVTLNRLEDGLIQAVWQTRDNQGRPIVIASRFSQAGVVDSTFGVDGAAVNLVSQLNIQLTTTLSTPSTTFFVGTTFSSNSDFWTGALDSRGKLLSAYATAGELKLDFPDLESRVHGFALRGDSSDEFSLLSQPTNSIGHFGRMVTTNLRSEMLLSRDWNGETNNNSEAEVFRTASGRTLFAKIVYANNAYSVVIENADVNGRLDASARLQIEGPTYMSFVKFRETSDGGVLVTGTATGYRDQALVFKLNGSGSLDKSFGEQGVKRLSNLPDYLFNVVEVDSEYWLLMADYFDSSAPLRVMALKRNGQSIDTFGYNGILTVINDSFSSRTYYDAIADGSSVVLLADNNFRLNLIRFNKDGLDRSFGRLGYADTTIAAPLREYPLQDAQIRRSYDRFVVASTIGGPNAATEIAVLNGQGRLSTEFGTNGKVKLDPTIYSDRMADVLPLRDGSILVALSSRSDQGEFGVVQRLLGPDPNPRPYYNIRFPLNVSAAQGDDSVTPLDVLMVVNQLNQNYNPPIGFVDTDGDGQVTPLDVLRIVNFLNGFRSQGIGEGERLSSDLKFELKTNVFETDQYLAKWDAEEITVKRKSTSRWRRD